MPQQCLIIDDDDLAIRLLEDFVRRCPGLQLAASFENALLAKEYLARHTADVLFLDIQMPYLTGLNFLEQLEQKPAVIITTSYPQYALEGYRLSVVDYLLKPFLFTRFEEAVQKATDYCHYRQLAAAGEAKTTDHLFVKSDHKMVKVLLADIFYVEGWKQYVKLHLADKFIVTLETMKQMEALLPAADFVRIHKSYIVNRHHITSGGSGEVTVKEAVLPVGKTYRQQAERLW